MKRIVVCSLAIFVCMSAALPTQAGLFGPSKRELMQRMIAQGERSNATLARMEVEQARQTELLRQIAGQGAQTQTSLDRVGDGIRQLGTATGQGFAPTNPLQLEALPPNAPRNPTSLQALPPNAPYNPTQLQVLPPNAPQNPTNLPAIDPPKPILGTSRSNASFAGGNRVVPVKVVSQPQFYVNPNYRR